MLSTKSELPYSEAEASSNISMMCLKLECVWWTINKKGGHTQTSHKHTIIFRSQQAVRLPYRPQGCVYPEWPSPGVLLMTALQRGIAGKVQNGSVTTNFLPHLHTRKSAKSLILKFRIESGRAKQRRKTGWIKLKWISHCSYGYCVWLLCCMSNFMFT